MCWQMVFCMFIVIWVTVALLSPWRSLAIVLWHKCGIYARKTALFQGVFLCCTDVRTGTSAVSEILRAPTLVSTTTPLSKSLKKILLTHSGARPCNQVYPSALEFLLCDWLDICISEQLNRCILVSFQTFGFWHKFQKYSGYVIVKFLLFKKTSK